MKGNISFL